MNVYDCMKAARMMAPNSALVTIQYKGKEGNKHKVKTICPLTPLGQCFVTSDSDFGAEEVTWFEAHRNDDATYVYLALAWKEGIEADYEWEVDEEDEIVK